MITYLKTLGRNLIWYKYSSNDNVWGSGMVCCNHISLPMLLIKAVVIISGEKNASYYLIVLLFSPHFTVVKSTNTLISKFGNIQHFFNAATFLWNTFFFFKFASRLL